MYRTAAFQKVKHLKKMRSLKPGTNLSFVTHRCIAPLELAEKYDLFSLSLGVQLTGSVSRFTKEKD